MKQNPFGNDLFGGQNPYDQLFGLFGQRKKKEAGGQENRPGGKEPGQGQQEQKKPER